MSDTFSLSDLAPLELADTTSKKVIPTLEQAETQRKSEQHGSLPTDPGVRSALEAAADKYNIPREYAFALAQQESGYNPKAFNSQYQASGMFQFIPATAKAHGIDPWDVAQSADAAMKDFAEQSKEKGISWAIKHHFAGPDEKLHGPKTEQYLADVEQRAQDIRGKLGPVEGAGGGGGGSVPVKKDTGTFSLADLGSPKEPAKQPEDEEHFYDPLVRAGNSAWVTIATRFKEDLDPTFVPEGMTRVPMTEEDVKSNAAYMVGNRGLYNLKDKTKLVADPDAEANWKQRIAEDPAAAKDLPKYLSHLKPMADTQGFIATLENPLKLLTEDSLPANFLSYYANLPKAEQLKVEKARKVAQQENIVANPDKFPPVAVEAAKAAIAKRKAEQDPTVGEMWHQLGEAAKEDPGKFGAQFVNALVADPELAFMPMQLGKSILKAGEVASATAKAAKVARAIIDSGATGAGINVAISAADQAARGTELDANALIQAGEMGAGAGVLFGYLLKGRPKLPDGLDPAANGKLDDILREQAKYDLLHESIIRDEWNGLESNTPMQARINEMLGITSKTDRAKMLKERRQQIKESFRSNEEYADYLKFKAEERIQRTQQIAAEHAQREFDSAREVRQRSEAAEAAEPSFTHPETGEVVGAAKVVEALRTPEAGRGPELKAAIEALKADVAQTKAVLADESIRGPRDQSGKVSPEHLKRIAVTTAAATAGAAMFPQDKVRGGLAGVMMLGLAGGARRVAARAEGMKGPGIKGRQMGAIRNPFEGEWHKGVQDDFAFHTAPLPDIRGPGDQVSFNWSGKAVKTYLNKYAGTANDPLKDVILPTGERWEELFDRAKPLDKESRQYWDEREKLGIPETVYKDIFDFSNFGEASYDRIRDYLSHVGDYLKLEVPSEKLTQYDLVRAVKETVAWDKANLAKAEKAAVKSMKDMPVYKEYPDGSKWVQLTKPGEFAQESDVMGHSVRGYEPFSLKDSVMYNDDLWSNLRDITERHGVPNTYGQTPAQLAQNIERIKKDFPTATKELDAWNTEYEKLKGKPHPDWIPASGDSGHSEYGFGGWDAIKNGDAKIYSLRDKEGRSHVTIEVFGGKEPQIAQIKGKGNAKPAAKYIPQVQDFVKSGKWADVEDLHNADMINFDTVPRVAGDKLKEMFGEGPYTKAEYDEALNHIDPKFKELIKKAQRGSIDPELALRLGLTTAGATAGAYFSADDHKLAGSIVGGLTAFLLPGGGRVVDRLRQSGAISADGFPISLAADAARLVKDGVLKATKKQEEIKAADFELIQRAADGDQRAFQKLYEDTAPKLVNGVKKYLREAGPKLALDANDIVQEAFISALPHLKDFRGDANFFTWMTSIARNEALQAVRKAQHRPDQISYDRPNTGGDETSELSGSPVLKAKSANVGAVTPVEDLIADMSTPEANAIRAETEQQILNTLNKLNPRLRDVFIKSEIELQTAQEISDELKQPLGTTLSQIKRAKDAVAEALQKGWSAKGARPQSGVQNLDTSIRGPRSQRGMIDERLLKTGALAALGAGAGAYLNDQNKLGAAALGAIALPAFTMLKGRGGKSAAAGVVEGTDYLGGIISTRIMNKSQPLWMKALDHERVVLKDTHENLMKVDPFLRKLNKLSKGVQQVLKRAILNGDNIVTKRVLEEIVQDPELTQGWKDVRSVLDKLGDQLVHYKRFRTRELDYFPRIVKDVDGLLKALGKERGGLIEEALARADAEAIKKRDTGLNEVERSLIINKMLHTDLKGAHQPGYAKGRSVEEITPELMQYYADPTESLHSYIRSAVQDIERAKFFGKDLVVVKDKAGKEYTNADKSIGKMVDQMIERGEIKPEDQAEIASIFKSRFINGERSPNELIQAAKNLSAAGLLGNPVSAAVQFGDTIAQLYVQDIRSTLEAIGRELTGKRHVKMQDFGLEDHIAEEFVSTSRSSKFVNTAFKYGLFKWVDQFGKNVGLNAAIIRAGRLAKSEKGQAELFRTYGRALGEDTFKAWIKDLNKGDKTDLVHQMAFAELSRSQPITRLELPQGYLDNPNGRVLYQFKTFMLKQADLVRRDAYNEIKKGDRKSMARGFKNLAGIGLTLGLAGMTTSQIKNFLRGRPFDFKGTDIMENALKTFGLTQYFRDHAFGVSKEEAAQRRAEGDKMARTTKASPTQAASDLIMPPYKMWDEIARADPKAWKYIPVIGPLLYDHVINPEKKK